VHSRSPEHRPAPILKCWERSYRRRQKTVKRRRLKSSEPAKPAIRDSSKSETVKRQKAAADRVGPRDVRRTLAEPSFVGCCLGPRCLGPTAPVSLFLLAHSAYLFQCAVFNLGDFTPPIFG